MHEAYQQLQKAEGLRARGEFDRARTICEPLVNRYPEYYGALHTLGLIYADQGHFPQALGCLVRAAMLDPQSWKALIALSTVYLELGASEMAARTLEQARQINTGEASIYLTLAEIYRSEREYELAYDAYNTALKLDATLHGAAIGLANCCLDLGRHNEAADQLAKLRKRGIKTLPVLALLAQLPHSDPEFDALSELEQAKPDPAENKQEFQNSVAFVRGGTLHKLGRSRDAWEEFVRANEVLWPHVRHLAEELRVNQRANVAAVKDRHIRPRDARMGEPETISLFILGPSRSGKTTVETLVSTLGGVKRGYENPALQKAIRRTFQANGLLTLKIFEALPTNFDAQCCEIYLEELKRRAGEAKVFTNTHPGRIHDVARIATAIPNARFIFVKRDLEDNLLRIFMQKYAVGNPDSYNLKAARDGIVWYHQMIDLLAEKLPDTSRIVHYEDMVSDPGSTVRMAAELCGLPAEHGPLPDIGDDRGCAAPYHDLLRTALSD